MSKSLLDRLEISLIEQLGVRIADLIAVGEYEKADKLCEYAITLAFDIADAGIGSLEGFDGYGY